MPKTKETESSNKFSWDGEYGSLLPPCAVWQCSFMFVSMRESRQCHTLMPRQNGRSDNIAY